MSWRQGLDIYRDVLKAIDNHEFDDDHRLDLKAELLAVFLYNDIDPVALGHDPDFKPIYDRFVEIKPRFERRISED